MTVQAAHFTPEVLLSAPRRSAGIPNRTGELILYSISTYSFETHSRSSAIRVLDVKQGSSHVITTDSAAHEPVWLDDKEVLFLKSGDNGSTMIMSQRVAEDSTSQMVYYVAGSISNVKLQNLSPGKVAICCSAPTTPEGDMYWPPGESKSHSTAKIYTSLYVRHWDSWETQNKSSLWYGQLTRRDDKWSLESPGFHDLLAGTRLSCPRAPFGGTGDFDVSTKAICFVAKDPDLNPARYTKTDLYYVSIHSFTEKPGSLQQVKTGSLEGYSLNPVFSKDGKRIAFARMKHRQYEADKTRLLLIPDVEDLKTVQEFYETDDGVGSWDMKPDWITWSHDNKELYVAAERHGRVVLWKLPSSPAEAKQLPEAIHEGGSVADAKVLGDGPSLFITTRSRVESSNYSILNPGNKSVTEISSTSKNGKTLGLSESQCDELWFRGSEGNRCHALVVKPSSFDPNKRYPLALLLHGGPQGAWTDDWSTRWNPAIFAEQGYVAVCPNFTGSTGYGQKYVDAIAGNWGSAPYEDVVKCFEYLKNEVDYVDTTRAVALGGSYGGFMINWIQGHSLGREFKALVCHDGIFSTQNLWSSEELFFPEHDFGGTLWAKRENYAKWDPSCHTASWATPQLVIHSDLDFRLPISEGLAMFNVLQARGVPSKLLVFPDENHWVLKPENSLVWHREVLNWINKYSGIAGEKACKAE